MPHQNSDRLGEVRLELPVFGWIESERVLAQDQLFAVVLDKYPVTPGHTLIIPRRALQLFRELTSGERVRLLEWVDWAQRHLEATTSPRPEGFNIGVNDGGAAGQTMVQFHFHVIPRRTGDVPDPRGGIRWVIPEKARYWSETGSGGGVEVVGIDVGVTKGLHVVALRVAGSTPGGTFTVLGNGVSGDEAVRLCLERKPSCVAIDSPPTWALAGNARQGENELRKLGIQLYATPSDVEKQQSAFYGWMKVGFKVFEALRSEYPLYRTGKVGRHALEVFPHATAVVLAGRHRPDGVTKAAWRKQILADHGYGVTGLRNSDCVDAALAAVTAAHAVRGSFSAFGDPEEGVIVTPHPDATECFRTALRNAS